MSANYPTSRRVLDFICEYYAEHKIPPTMIEIGIGAGVKSTSTTFYHVTRLAEDGYITRTAGIARGVVPTGKKIDPNDFAQYKIKQKVNPSDPYGGKYDRHNASVRQSEQGTKARRSNGHKQPATMPMANTSVLESGPEHRGEHERDTPSRQRKAI